MLLLKVMFTMVLAVPITVRSRLGRAELVPPPTPQLLGEVPTMTILVLVWCKVLGVIMEAVLPV